MTDPIQSVGAATGVSSASGSNFTQARQDALNAAAQALSMTPGELRSAMANGETLSQLASEKGVSATDLQNTIETSLKKDLPGANATQLAALAARMVNGSHAHGAHGHGHAGGAAGSSSASAQDATGDWQQSRQLARRHRLRGRAQPRPCAAAAALVARRRAPSCGLRFRERERAADEELRHARQEGLAASRLDHPQLRSTRRRQHQLLDPLDRLLQRRAIAGPNEKRTYR